MFFDAAMMARARAEIDRMIVGAKVREPIQLRHDEVLLVFGRDLPEAGLLLSSSPEAGRVCLASPDKPGGAVQAFGMALRKHLRGARLRAAVQPTFDRALRLEFEECMGFGRESRRALVVEVMGKHGNMMLLDENEIIISCAKHVPGRLNRYREIMDGEPYVSPPRFDKLDPREAVGEAWRERAAAAPGAELHEFLIAHCLGTSKVFTAEVRARFGAVPVMGDLPPERFAALADVLRGLAEEAQAEGPAYAYEGSREQDLPARFAYPMRLQCCGAPVGEAPHLGAALSPILEAELTSRRFREMRQRLIGAVGAQLRDSEKRLAGWRERVRKAEAAEEDRKIGELLLAQPHAVKPYAETAELVDYFAPDAPTITVTLDPPGDLHATAEKRFARYKRARRLLQRVPPLMERAEQESEYLESVLAEIELAEELADLAPVEQELAEQGYLRAKGAATRPASRGARVAPKLRTHTSREGYPILYGTNHLQNEELVRVASPDDVWLHVQGAPGAHVLIRADGQPERVPSSTLAEAAQIAARWSRLRGQGTVEVDYTLAKYVRKAKDGRPGMVFYTHQKTLTVRV